jgi:transcriptional regulator with XRE-family HTH domain
MAKTLVRGQVAESIEKTRNEANLSQQEFAILLGFAKKDISGQSTVSAWERGHRPIRLKPSQTKALAKFLKTTPSALTKALLADETARKGQRKNKAATPTKAPAKAASKAPKAKAAPKKAKAASKVKAKRVVSEETRAKMRAAHAARKAAKAGTSSLTGVTVNNTVERTPTEPKAKFLEKAMAEMPMSNGGGSNGQPTMAEQLITGLLINEEPSLAGVDPAAIVRVMHRYQAVEQAIKGALAYTT